MKEAYYFSHDSNARHDPKISAMRGVYGAEGYGWYWMLVEMMRDSDGYKLDMQSKYTFNAFALQLQADSKRVQEFIMDCINEFHLFTSDGKSFWSNSLNRRMDKREEVKAKRSAAARARWDKEKQVDDGEYTDAEMMHLHSTSNAEAMQGKESKVKERKGNKKEKETPSDSPLANPDSSVSDSSKQNERKKRIYDEDSTYYRMSLYFKGKVDQMAESEGLEHLTANTNLQTWSDDFRKLVENDKQSDLQLIQKVMDWVVKDDFWYKNVLSASSFRDKFPRLVLDMKKDGRGNKGYKGGSNKPHNPVVEPTNTGPNVSDDEFEAMMRIAQEMQANKGGREHA
ncbi:DUF4373 domain-containing protein [Paenibacillus sp. KQZ6P-2]|uniref:DUF4373 domain-containing protein n=1 Tax=Paenibacillus mangrovi TaxID=2931978 RepID=A0A9X1WTZ3_9BACL|nr:DUF4373 domain-containing protein [Paenibacillus mangrovi]MCJ8015247.1 DUF4373 domain-containing protein [Paenibacillus mangrovi]